MVARASVALYCNPAFVPGLEALAGFLLDNNYSAHAMDQIIGLASVEGTVTGSAYLEPEDEAGATEAFVAALPDVADDSPAWDDPSVILDVELLLAAAHPYPMPPEPAEEGAEVRRVRRWYREHMAGFPAPPSIRGGSDEAEPFEPSAEDLADYHAWSEALERRRTAAEVLGDRHSPDALARINRALYGRSEPFHA